MKALGCPTDSPDIGALSGKVLGPIVLSLELRASTFWKSDCQLSSSAPMVGRVGELACCFGGASSLANGGRLLAVETILEWPARD